MPPKKPAAGNQDAPAAKNGAARIFLVYGSDDLTATRKADEIAHRLCPPAEQAFGLETIAPDADLNADAIGALLRNVAEALLTPSFLGGAKTVYLRGGPFFNPRTEPGRFESVKTEVTRLTDLLKKGLPAGVAFLVLTPAVDKTTAFYKTCASLGEVHGFDEPEKDREAEEEFIPAVEKLLAEKGVAMPRPVFHAFLDRTGYQLRQVTAEIEKLSLYLGDRKTATLEDIQLMVAPMRESKFYEFADTFCGGDLAKTLGVMHRLFEQRVSPVALLVNLQDRLRMLMIMADCLKRGWARLSGGEKWRKLDWDVPPEGEAVLGTLEKDPRKGNPYAISLMAAQAARFPAGRWYRWFTAAVDAQAAMTGGEAVDPEVALELFATRTLGELTVAK
jgi:DNA polymerase III delta subunit